MNAAWGASAPGGASSHGTVTDDTFLFMGVWCFYSYAYVLTGLFLQRTFLPRQSPVLASIIAFVIPAVWAVLPNFTLFLFNRLTWNVMETLQLGNVFNVMLTRDIDTKTAHLWFAAGWAALALLANVPWFIRQVRAFKPWPKTVKEVSS
jgi:hypothetical protein